MNQHENGIDGEQPHLSSGSRNKRENKTKCIASLCTHI